MKARGQCFAKTAKTAKGSGLYAKNVKTKMVVAGLVAVTTNEIKQSAKCNY
jgi:hypothetical protein